MKLSLKPSLCLPGLLILLGGAALIGAAPAQARSRCDRVGPIPTPTYTVISPPGGANGDINDFNETSLLLEPEERVTLLTSSFVITYECTDTDGVIDFANLLVRMTGFTPPQASGGAENLDNPRDGTEAVDGINHRVTITAIGNDTRVLFGEINGLSNIVNRANINPRTGDRPLVNILSGGRCPEDDGSGSGQFCELDSNDRISLLVESTFSVTGDAEEFLAGNYGVSFRFNAVPSGNNGVGNRGGSNPRRLAGRSVVNLSYDVSEECSIQQPSLASLNDNPIDYQLITAPGGNNSIQDAGALEERAILFTASDSLGVDCNTSRVAVDLSLDRFNHPGFANATNLTDVAHTISLDTPSRNLDRVIDPAPLVTTPVTIFSGIREVTDPNGDLDLSLTSTIASNSEELASGNYNADFTVTVTAE